MTMLELHTMTLEGLRNCLKRDPDDKPRCDSCPYTSACLNRLKHDALTLIEASLPAQSVRHAVCNAEKPTCVTDEQFMAVLGNVCTALIDLERRYNIT